MDQSLRKQLEQARADFYSWRLVEAYHLLRRFFGRLPFRPEPEHAEFIGMFVRVLLELGKNSELRFYIDELERLNARTNSPELRYQLAYVYMQDSKKWELARDILESIIRNPEANALHSRAKMMLAYHYSLTKDWTACRNLIESISKTGDAQFDRLVEIWRGNLFRYERQYDSAIAHLDRVVASFDHATDWYAYLTAMITKAKALIEKGDVARGTEIAKDLEERFKNKTFKSVRAQIDFLLEMISEKTAYGNVSFAPGRRQSKIFYGKHSLLLSASRPAEKFLCLLLKKGFVNRDAIFKRLYFRPYDPATDEKLLQSHLASARKKLATIGLDANAIQPKKNGFAFIPEIEILEEVW